MFESKIESRLQGLMEKKETGERETDRGREERTETLTHISITMPCQWSVCEVSCCLVTVL